MNVDPPEGTEGPPDPTLEAAIARLTEVVEGFQRLVDVRLARARVEIRERTFRALAWILLAAVLITLIVRATVQVMHGISGLINELFPSLPWAGDLLTGLAGLALAAVVGLAARASVRRKGLARIRRKFEADPTDPSE